MFFTRIMKRLFSDICIIFSLVLCFMVACSCTNKEDTAFTAQVKIALRDAGNQLLLINKDSTSLILPVLDLKNSKYRLSFDNELSFNPEDLVSVVYQSTKKAVLPEVYRVEVIQCNDLEVAYSYQMDSKQETTIIPCNGRVLPKNCYHVDIQFTNRDTSSVILNKQLFWIILLGVILLITGVVVFWKRQYNNTNEKHKNYAIIGSFQFYPERNKLVKSAKEIGLSKKECELLEIFCEHLNEVVKREVLEKRVWEDNGVVVGRSLDTYISKLRKKFHEDPSIKITNVHGVGYKLQVFQK